jgi:archaeal cell division control protein 6
MGLFDGMLKEGESLIKIEEALSFDFIPKLVPYREYAQKYMASCIAPLLQNRNGKNLFIYGPPGIGKTTAAKWVLRDLEENSEDVVAVYINCWQKNSSFKIILEICDILGYKLTHNKRTDELFTVVKNILNKKVAVFMFDEVDKIEDLDFLYSLLEEIYRKSIILITNPKDWLVTLDSRIKSRLMADTLEFKPYTKTETEGILRQRRDFAFVPNVWEEAAFRIIVDKVAEFGDIRTGLFLMKEAALCAEQESSKKITAAHAAKIMEKLYDFYAKDKEQLKDDEQEILSFLKENSGKKIGDLYKQFTQSKYEISYKTFQRNVKKLADSNFISVEKTDGGSLGNTTIITCPEKTKKITDF